MPVSPGPGAPNDATGGGGERQRGESLRRGVGAGFPVVKPPAPTTETAGTLEESRWFAEEVFPHESSLRTYLRSSFPGLRDIDDIVQECYLRMFRTRAVQPIKSARAFLFSIARRMSIDVVRKDHRKHGHEVLVDPMSLQLADPGLDAAEAASAREEIALLAEAIHALPARCREIVILRRVDGLAQREIAERLGISVPTVETQLRRGMEKCARHFRRNGVAMRPRLPST